MSRSISDRQVLRAALRAFAQSGKRHLFLAGVDAAVLKEEACLLFSPAASWLFLNDSAEIDKSLSRQTLCQVMEKQHVAAAFPSSPPTSFQPLLSRDDVFFCDIHTPLPSLGCVIMASGLGRRFGSNKLMADFCGQPMIARILDATEGLFARRILVTRHADVERFAATRGISVLRHELPHRNDTVRIGLEAIAADVHGCMFCPGDQPLLERETLLSMVLSHASTPSAIWQLSFGKRAGTPVLFPQWAFPQLLKLPQGKGGSIILQENPASVRLALAQHEAELMDVDTPEQLAALCRILAETKQIP